MNDRIINAAGKYNEVTPQLVVKVGKQLYREDNQGSTGYPPSMVYEMVEYVLKNHLTN